MSDKPLLVLVLLADSLLLLLNPGLLLLLPLHLQLLTPLLPLPLSCPHLLLIFIHHRQLLWLLEFFLRVIVPYGDCRRDLIVLFEEVVAEGLLLDLLVVVVDLPVEFVFLFLAQLQF